MTAALVGLASCLAGGAAYAFWSATATGAATAAAPTAVLLEVDPVPVPPGDLYPGSTADLGLRLSNANPYPVLLTDLTSLGLRSDDEAACPAATALRVSDEVALGVAGSGYALPTPIPVAAGARGVDVTLPGLVSMTRSAPDGCQGRTFTFALSFSGSQV